MGKYALGNPKNNWSDRHRDIKAGDCIHVSYYSYYSAALQFTQEPAEKDYRVLRKHVQLLDDDWVEWDLEDLRTGDKLTSLHLNKLTQTLDHVTGETRARLRKLTDSEVESITADPNHTVEGLPHPMHPKDTPYKPYGAYPKPGKPRKYDDPKPGERWKNNEIGMGGYPITIEQYELWGTKFPAAVTFREERAPDVLHRLPLDWFKRRFCRM